MENKSTKIVIILEGKVKKENWETLTKIHKETTFLPEGLLSTVLVQSKEDQFIWKMINTWDSLSSFEKAHPAGKRPGGVHMFETAEAELKPASFFQVLSIVSSDTKEIKE